MDLDRRMRQVAELQHSVIARRGARQFGLTRAQVERRVGGGAWDMPTPRVLRLVGSMPTDGQRMMIGVLDAGPGAVLSHRSAAAWWGLPGFALDPIHVTRPRGPREPGYVAVLHEVRTLRIQDVTALHGVPIVRPERLALELFATENPLRAERACETMWSRRLLSAPSARRYLEAVGGRGVAGTVALRDYLDCRPEDYVPSASGLERRFEQVLAQRGQGPMRRQVDSGGGTWIGRVDYRDPDLPLIVEIQSELFHTALVDAEADAARFAALREAGFTVLAVWDTEVWHDPAAVVARIREARRVLRELPNRTGGESAPSSGALSPPERAGAA